MTSFQTKSLFALCSAAMICAAAFSQDHKPAAPPATTPKPTATAPASQPAARKDLPEAKTLVKAAIEAMGGKKAFEDIESMLLKATMTTPMGDMNMDMTTAKPNKFLLKQSSPMGEATAGCDGTTAWRNVAMMGGYSLMADDEAKQAKDQANMFRMVLNMEDDFPTMETVDKTDFGGAPCYKVKMVNKDGEEQMAFFNADTKLIQGVEIAPQGGMGSPATITFTDWKEIGKLKVYTKMNIEQMGQAMTMTFTTVEFNKVDPTVFALPTEVKALLEKKNAPATAPAATKPAAPAAGTKPAGH